MKAATRSRYPAIRYPWIATGNPQPATGSTLSAARDLQPAIRDLLSALRNPSSVTVIGMRAADNGQRRTIRHVVHEAGFPGAPVAVYDNNGGLSDLR